MDAQIRQLKFHSGIHPFYAMACIRPGTNDCVPLKNRKKNPMSTVWW